MENDQETTAIGNYPFVNPDALPQKRSKKRARVKKEADRQKDGEGFGDFAQSVKT